MLKNKYLWLTFAALLTLALVFTACGPGATSDEQPEEPESQEPAVEPEETKDEPVVLRVGGLDTIDCWNPQSCVSIWFFGYLVYEGFTGHGPASEGCPGVPRLADSWEVSDDGLTWTIYLHDNITFNDGTPFNANTVVEYIDWHNSTDLIVQTAETLSMVSYEALDDLTFRYTTADPIVNSADYDFQWWFMAPPHIWSEFDNETLWDFESFPPVGTGPYVVAEWEPGSHVIYEAREDYYRGKPPIDRVVYQVFANNDAMVSALIAGEIDLTLPSMPPESYETLVAAENVDVEVKPPGAWHELIFNMHSEGIKNPAIDDPKVREAIDYAIDKEKLIEVALLGQGTTCATNWGCGPNYEDEMDPSLKVTPFDLAKSAQILDDAGYVDSDNDGVRETPDGEPLVFRISVFAEIPSDLVMADLIADTLSEVGITAEVEVLESSTWYATIMDERNFDMAIDTEPHDIDPASLDFWFSCWSADVGSGAMNFPGYCNEEFDELVYEFWFSDDLEGRWEPMYKAQGILNQDRPIINLAGENSIQAWRSDRFDFPRDTCDVGLGMMDPESLLQATVK